MHPKKTLIAAALLFVLWAAGFAAAFRAEFRAISILPGLYSLNEAGKAALAGGPVNSFAFDAASVVPPGASLYVLEPEDIALAGHLAWRLNYHLYPIRAVRVRKDGLARPGAVEPGGFVAIYMKPQSFAPLLERTIVERNSLVPIYSKFDESGRRAIYMARGEAGR